jgi:hypothetical protein
VTVLVLVVAALAAARVTRLVVDDTILDTPRGWVMDRVQGWWADLLACPWCVSAYISAGIFAITWHLHRMPVPLFSWLAVWWGACAAYWFAEMIAGIAIWER